MSFPEMANSRLIALIPSVHPLSLPLMGKYSD